MQYDNDSLGEVTYLTRFEQNKDISQSVLLHVGFTHIVDASFLLTLVPPPTGGWIE